MSSVYQSNSISPEKCLKILWPYFKAKELERLAANKLWLGQTVKLSGISKFRGRWELLDPVYFPLALHNSNEPIGTISDIHVSCLYLEEHFLYETPLLKSLERNAHLITTTEDCIPLIENFLTKLRASLDTTGSTTNCLCYYTYTLNFLKEKPFSSVRYPLCETFLSPL
jgi:hypothetical protein